MSTALLGVMFLVVGFAAMFLMYHLWGYPFDKVAHKSSAPQWAMYLHRGLGYLFALIYIALMIHMVPRLWRYQIEFPARTTAHIILGFTIGFLLLVKISIMRFFRHFEEWMPYLGTSIMLGTILLLGLSLPFVLQECSLNEAADVSSPETLARVKAQLPTAGLPQGTSIDALATTESLEDGRKVLLDKCVRCHDLKTILAKPKPAAGWWDTVQRMAEKPALFAAIEPVEQLQVTAYLTAITPEIQKGTKKKRDAQVARMDEVKKAADAKPVIDHAKAKAAFMMQCSQCHDTTNVDNSPPKTAAEAMALVQRMVTDNDAKISADDIVLISAYIAARYVDKTEP
jgi:mono/diheme cytochrome c family protein